MMVVKFTFPLAMDIYTFFTAPSLAVSKWITVLRPLSRDFLVLFSDVNGAGTT